MIKIGIDERYRLIPLARMATISLFFEREPNVNKVAKRTAAGNIKDNIQGIRKRKELTICSKEALFLISMPSFSKKSIIRKSERNVRMIRRKNLRNSLEI
jgi:hypothetical protein